MEPWAGVAAAASFQPQTITHIVEIRPAVRRPGKASRLSAIALKLPLQILDANIAEWTRGSPLQWQ